MDILLLAEENFVISFVVAFVIGLLHGSILGRGIRKRFPSFKKHAKVISIILLVLFTVNTITNVLSFAEPTKIPLSELLDSNSVENAFTMIFNTFGLNIGFGTTIGISISVIVMVFLRFAELPQIARYFIFTLSAIILLVTLLATITDFVPNVFQIMLFAFYQFGITLGIFFVTRRKDELYEIE